MVTEFGGASSAQSLVHLENSLHAGLWASTCIPVGGTPLFWWWGLIEEENYYPEFLAVSRFMKGADRRDPALLPYHPELSMPNDPNIRVQSCSLKSGNNAMGWVYDTLAFNTSSSEAHPTISNLVATLKGMSNNAYRIEFWDTTEGVLTKHQNVKTSGGTLSFAIPPFSRDIAFKVMKQ
jgi:hypothetical protein